MREGARTADRQGPSPISPCLPDLPRLPPQDSGHPEGLRRTKTALPCPPSGKGVPPEREAPGPCLPALLPSHQPAGRRGGAPVSHRRRRTAELHAGSRRSPRSGPTRPPHWLPVTCRGAPANQRRQNAPAGRFGNFRYFQKALGGGGRAGPTEPSPALTAAPERGGMARPRLRAPYILTPSPGTRQPR